MKLTFPFPIELSKEIILLSKLFTSAGHQLYLVGGAVRDALMGLPPKDIDLATDADPDKIIDLVSNVLGTKVLDVGKAFGVIRAIFPSGLEVEVATFRKDIGKGRRPESVVFSTIEEDVKRRDLTINALFYDLQQGHIVDMVGGMADVQNRVIRTVGDPMERFDEDRLRIMRAVRFAAQFGCELESQTENAIESLNKYVKLRGVSPERIRDELMKGIKKAHSVTHFTLMLKRLNLWEEILPNLNVEITNAREIKDPTLFLAVLLQGNSTIEVQDVLHEMKYSTNEVREVSFLLAFAWLNRENAMDKHKVFRSLKLDPDLVRKYAEFRKMPSRSLVETFLKYEPEVTGQQLLDEGFQGKELGIELERRQTLRFCQLLDEEDRDQINPDSCYSDLGGEG